MSYFANTQHTNNANWGPNSRYVEHLRKPTKSKDRPVLAAPVAHRISSAQAPFTNRNQNMTVYPLKCHQFWIQGGGGRAAKTLNPSNKKDPFCDVHLTNGQKKSYCQ